MICFECGNEAHLEPGQDRGSDHRTGPYDPARIAMEPRPDLQGFEPLGP